MLVKGTTGDVIWRQKSWSTIVHVMAYCLTAPSHYLNQCWLIIKVVLWHSRDNISAFENYSFVHDDVIKWKHFPWYWPFVKGIHRWPVTGELPAQWPMTRSFDVFFDLRPNKWLSKQWRRWWFETPSRSLWCQCNGSPRHFPGNHYELILTCGQFSYSNFFLWNSMQHQYIQIFINENVLKNVVGKMATILFRPQRDESWVTHCNPSIHNEFYRYQLHLTRWKKLSYMFLVPIVLCIFNKRLLEICTACILQTYIQTFNISGTLVGNIFLSFWL